MLTNPPRGTAVLGQVGAVQDAKLLGRFLRRRRAGQAGEGLNVVGAVHLYQRVQLGLAAKREARRCGDTDACVGLFEGAATDILTTGRDTARELDEVHKVPADVGKRFNLLPLDHSRQLGFRGFDEGWRPVTMTTSSTWPTLIWMSTTDAPPTVRTTTSRSAVLNPESSARSS